MLTVRDNGPGVSPDARERVFDPFFTTKKTGLGMGLHICQSILESHRGSLKLGDAEGPGAEFCLDLPCGTAGSVGAVEARSA